MTNTNMATIVLISNIHNNIVDSVRPTGRRDIVDVLVYVLKCVTKTSIPFEIQRAVKANLATFKLYLAILCRFGLLTEAVIKRKCRLKNKKTEKRETQIRKRYYLTPKGHDLVDIYDKMLEQLVMF